MPLGGLNGCPFRVGGAPTEATKAYTFLKRAVGVGGSARNEHSLEALWRRSRAKGLAAAASATRRAMNQAWPQYATDALPYYERVLRLPPEPNATEAQRREVVFAEWTARISAVLPELEHMLKRIDSRISIRNPPNAQATTTQLGRAFGPHEPSLETPLFGGNGYSIAPNYSTDFAIVVLFDIGYPGPPNAADKRIMERLRSKLLRVVPAWCDFWIITSVGFQLGVSRLGLTGLAP